MQRIVPGLGALLVSLPVYVVWIIGIILAVVRWSRHPRVSALAVAGLGILLLQGVISSLLSPWLQMTLIQGNIMPSRLGLVFGLLGFGAALIRALGWGLVLAALFTERHIHKVA